MTGRTSLIAALAVLVASAAYAQTTPPSLQDGLNAYRDNRVADAERIFHMIAADQASSSDDRAGAERELGRIAWLARGQTQPIADALARAPSGHEACATATLAARIFRESAHANVMTSQAAQKLPGCQGQAANDLRVQLALDELSGASGAERASALQGAAGYLADLRSAGAQAPDACGARLSLALTQRDAGAAFNAWRDYYWLTDTDTPQAMPAYAGHVQATFAAGLATGASPDAVLDLLTMLARAGFLEDVRQFATDSNIASRAGHDQRWTRIAALLRFDTDLDALMLRTNRALMARQNAPHLGADADALMRRLLQNVGAGGDMRQKLLETYGLYGTAGETGGFPSLHIGFVVQNDRIHVAQYGHSGDLRFIVINHMLANGYQSWLWDGWAEVGGWAPDDATIVQVRSAYTTNPVNELALSRPGPSRDRFLARIAEAAPQERAALANGAVTVLPATSDRLELQAVDAMTARTRGDDAAFVAESWRAALQHSIYIHEGRHVLDKAIYRGPLALSDEELEFRAKLSELALADYPRLALSNISAGNVGDGTAHGNANARILTAYRDWMGAHAGEILGYDASIPALAQLDKLSDAQIHTVARSLDPWAH